MMEPEIKLFGKKITLPDNASGGVSSVDRNNGDGGFDPSFQVNGEKQLPAEEDQVAQLSETEMQEKDQDQVTAEEKQNPTVSSELDQNSSIDEDSTSENNSKPENGTQKPLKKPDKILPCPRCNSMDTKFCYYNNYNVNQPRHFCKGCQRYWTAGGTMRNVPVGAGRRKNKNSASHCCHITISESLQADQVDPRNRFHHHTGFKPNGSVLSFGPDAPLCESMASGLNLAENRDDNSVAQLGENCPQEQVMTNINNVAVPYPVPCIPGVAWPFPTIPLPAICPPAGYPMPFYPAPYWNCGMPNAWNVVPWVSPLSPSANLKGTGSCPNSPLGKHSRNGELLKVNGSDDQQCLEPKSLESSIVVPKTLRIDDPEEAAKSSIWETLGIKYDSVRREGLFKALQPKGDEKKVTVSASPAALHANPAAFSRSISFRESA